MRYEYSIDFWKINKGVTNLNKLSKTIENQCHKQAFNYLITKLESVLKQNISLCGYPDLVNYIHITKKKNSIIISIDAPFAKFLEYGTGIKGASNPNPDAGKIGWAYMSGQYSGRGGGWWYPASKIYGKQRTFVSKRDGKVYAYTNGGLPAGMFMYKTFKYAKNQSTRIFRRFLMKALEESGAKAR